MDYNSPSAHDGYEGAASYPMLNSSLAAVENNVRYEGEEVDFSKYSSKVNPGLNQKPVANKFMQFEHRPEELLP